MRLTATQLAAYFAIIAGVIALALIMNASAERDRLAMARLQACITDRAHAQHYTGNVHALEAWQLFAMDCQSK